MQKQCEKCGAMFEAVRISAKFCSKPCAYSAWLAKNADKRASSQAKYYEKNREAVLVRGTEWAQENRERSREIKRKHYALNRDETIARSAVYAKENPEKTNAYKAKYSKTDAGRLTGKAAIHRRRARLLANGGSFSRAEWLALVERTGNKCLACKAPGTATSLEADHIVPIKLGGSNDIANIQPLCRACNRRKSAKEKNYMSASTDAPEPENGT